MTNLVGKVLAGRYRVDDFVGKGGMAEVYKVWDRERAAYLAMKVLYSDLAEDKVFLRRFEREAETLSSLQHPHIVRFYGLKRDSGLSFMLMDYVEGTTLRKQIFEAPGPFSPEQILHIMRPVCSALHYAHEMGRVHCDVKPANIMIRSNGDVLVADFGIARMMESGTTMTMVGAGTPAYMAPEQVLGKKPSPQTDIYSLGIILYEMVTGGERPFTGEQAKIDGTTSEKVRWEQAKLPPPSPREINPAISHDLEDIILTCLKKDRTQRYSAVLELLQALEQALGGDKIPKEQVTLKISENQLINEVRQSRKKEIPKKSSSPVIKIGMGISITIFVLLGIILIATLPPFLAGIKNSTPVILTVIVSSTFDSPIATQTSTEPAVSPSKAPSRTPEPTRAEPTPTEGLQPEIVDPKGAVMILVPEGKFQMGAIIRGDLNFKPNETPLHTVSLDAYYIDKFEVTNALYEACVNANACEPPKQIYFFPTSPNSDYYGNPQFDKFPVVYVEWSMANAYCEWRGARLPTEAEWEKAARGTDEIIYPWGKDVRIYPWNGTELTCQRANYQNCVNFTSEVGSYNDGRSQYGVYDMAGNVWEWVADWYAENYYEKSLGKNPPGPDRGLARVQRGGSWTKYDIRVSNRISFAPNYNNFDIGFRCARSIP